GTLALTSSATISNTPTITIAAGATLDVTGRSDQKLTLLNGQTLRGSGTNIGALVVNAGATVAPGLSVGTLTVAGSVSLGGTNEMEVDKVNNTNDTIRCVGGTSINYGGTLRIVLLNNALQANDALKLFSATIYNGSFASIVPATPGPN